MLIAAPASAAGGNTGFGFNATDISGFPAGAGRLTGGAAYNLGTDFVKSASGGGCNPPAYLKLWDRVVPHT